MVVPSPEFCEALCVDEKQVLRKELKAKRRSAVETLPTSISGLVFRHPPAPLLAMIPQGATIGLYHATPHEAPTAAYAQWFHERGFPIALPWFAQRGAAMRFRLWSAPYADLLAPDPYGALQPSANAGEVIPDVIFVPLIGFTVRGERLGQGGGHYDRWLEAQPDALAIGLAWDCQKVEALPNQPHDRHLAAVVTPTRFYETPGFMRKTPDAP